MVIQKIFLGFMIMYINEVLYRRGVIIKGKKDGFIVGNFK